MCEKRKDFTFLVFGIKACYGQWRPDGSVMTRRVACRSIGRSPVAVAR